jgi:hypothetical protein
MRSDEAVIAIGRFAGLESAGGDAAGCVVYGQQQRAPWSAAFKPVVRGAVHLDELSETRSSSA